MKIKIDSIFLMIVISLSVPQPVMAQAVVDDAVKVVGGFIDLLGRKKKSSKTKNNNQQKTSTVQQSGQQTASAHATPQEGIKKDKWVEAIYPGGGWLLPGSDDVVQVRLNVNREYSITGNVWGWGDIELMDEDVIDEGRLGPPTLKGNIYSFDITSKKGISRIGIQKLRDNPDESPYLKIAEVSGAIAKWVKQGSKLFISQGNGRLYNPTILAMTENELDDILKRCNDDNYIDYNWWVKNRKNSSVSSTANTGKPSGKLNSKVIDEVDTIPEIHDEVNNPPLQRTTTTAVNNLTTKGELGIFELRGPVKKCVSKNSNETSTHEFDKKGMWISENGMKPWAGQESVKRDRQGRIVKMGDSYDEEYESFAYNANGLITKRIKKYMDGIFQTNYYYNSKGECTKSVLEFEDMGDTGKDTTVYTILSRDSHGNWTKRKTQKGAIETRTITYY